MIVSDDQQPPPWAALRPIVELRDSGLLWMINRMLLHPRGYSLGVDVDEHGHATGWYLIGDGSEPHRFTDSADRRMFTAAIATLAAADEAAARLTPEQQVEAAFAPALQQLAAVRRAADHHLGGGSDA